MTDSSSTDPDTAGLGQGDGAQPPATPRWVKITGVVLALVVAALLAKAVFGGGISGHGPGMHGGLGAATPATGASGVAQALPGG